MNTKYEFAATFKRWRHSSVKSVILEGTQHQHQHHLVDWIMYVKSAVLLTLDFGTMWSTCNFVLGQA
jgi:hypothetical protein